VRNVGECTGGSACPRLLSAGTAFRHYLRLLFTTVVDSASRRHRHLLPGAPVSAESRR